MLIFAFLLISFYFIVVLSAFIIAINYFMKTHDELPVKETLDLELSYIENLDIWYGYYQGKYICSGKTQEECLNNAISIL